MEITLHNLNSIPRMATGLPKLADISPDDVKAFLAKHEGRTFLHYDAEASDLEMTCHLLEKYYNVHQPCMFTNDLRKLYALRNALVDLRLKERDL